MIEILDYIVHAIWYLVEIVIDAFKSIFVEWKPIMKYLEKAQDISFMM